MKKYILFLFLLTCGESDKLHKVCPNKCFAVPGVSSGIFSEQQSKLYKKYKNVGVCKEGVPVCDTNKKIIFCDGEILPSEETCDGLDNDCDGEVDEYLDGYSSQNFNWFYPNESNPCRYALGECGNSTVNCENNWVCDFKNTVELPDEVSCDGLDNDCDGIADDNLFTGQYCYTGPIGTELNLPCHPGAMYCDRGNIICANEVTPVAEVCDAIDNDCDGIIDDFEGNLTKQYDVVFIVDTSGSMCNEINAVATACNAYAQQFDGNTNFKFAIVIMSSIAPPWVYVQRNFSDFSTIRNDLQSLGCTGGGLEASIDSMLFVCDTTTNSLNLNWRSGSNKLFFLFTDESEQTYTSLPTTNQDVISACLASNTLPFVWANDVNFQQVTNGANGLYFNLVSDWNQIFSDMNSVIIRLCGE